MAGEVAASPVAPEQPDVARRDVGRGHDEDAAGRQEVAGVTSEGLGIGHVLDDVAGQYEMEGVPLQLVLLLEAPDHDAMASGPGHLGRPLVEVNAVGLDPAPMATGLVPVQDGAVGAPHVEHPDGTGRSLDPG